MVMRYHFGLGVGHVYSHGSLQAYASTINDSHAESISPNLLSHSHPNEPPPEPVPGPTQLGIRLHDAQFGDSDEDSDYESSLASDNLDWDDSDSDDQGELDDHDDNITDDEEIAAEEMYLDD